MKWCVWDTETTGVRVEEDRIITAYIRAYDGDKVVNEHEWVIDPGIDIPEEASNVHGMDTAWIKEHGQKDAKNAIYQIADWLATYSHEGAVTTGYNNSFDLSILDYEVQRHFGIEGLPALMGTKPRFIDLLILDRQVDRYRKGSRKLLDVAKHYGVELDETRLHAADYDVHVTHRILKPILNLAASKVPELRGLNAEQIIDKLQVLQAEWKRDWADHLTEYFESAGKTEDDGSKIIVSGAFPW